METLKKRLKMREGTSGLSDARLEHLEDMVSGFEPLHEIRKENHLKISTDLPFARCLREVLSRGHSMRCAQIAGLLEKQASG